MRKILMFVTALAVITLMTIAPVFAGDYFGFGLGTATRPEVIEKLKAGGAKFDTDYSYKGRGVLPTIKIHSYTRFNRLGQVKAAWLQFDPSGKLYFITVTWFDGGKTFASVQDGLAAKYHQESTAGFGFNSSLTYRDGTSRIVLERDTFGFGNDRTTSLSYIHTPSETSVQQTKDKIEQEIRQENAARTGSDL